ncbi:Diaminopimelate epimerase [subsurface metagenome]
MDARAPSVIPSEAENLAELARDLCRHHFGIGADGLILVQDSELANVKMRMFNPDGSESEACGNGLRCFVKYVVENDIAGKVSLQAERDNPCLTIETLSGLRKAKASISGGKVSEVDVSMGVPQFQPDQIPIKAKVDIIPILDYHLPIGERRLAVSILSMGNPHAVSFLSEPVPGFPLAEVGPKVERHPMFPQRTNFEIARVLSKGKIEARVWERGVGETLACGSGACAIAVAGQLLNYVGEEVDITFPGGIVTVFWDRVGEVVLSGPVEEVFAGESQT